jgi:hypothetical protein
MPRAFGSWHEIPQPTAAQSAATAQYVREFPPRYAVAEALREMVTRGLHLCVLNSGGMEIYCNHEGQFRDAFRDVEFGTALTTGYFRNADHTFTETSQQRALHHTIAAWLRGVFPAR